MSHSLKPHASDTDPVLSLPKALHSSCCFPVSLTRSNGTVDKLFFLFSEGENGTFSEVFVKAPRALASAGRSSALPAAPLSVLGSPATLLGNKDGGNQPGEGEGYQPLGPPHGKARWRSSASFL